MSALFADKLNQPIKHLPGCSPYLVELLKGDLGLTTYEDLLNFFPIKYDDRSKLVTIKAIREPGYYFVFGKLTPSRHYIRQGKPILQSTLVDQQGGKLKLYWFNRRHFIEKILIPGAYYWVYGKLSHFNGEWMITHPEMKPYQPGQNLQRQLTPRYPIPQKLKKIKVQNAHFIQWIGQVCKELLPLLEEILPQPLLDRYKLIGHAQAYADIHAPKDHAALHQAQRRLKFQNLFLFYLMGHRARLARQAAQKGIPLPNNTLPQKWRKALYATLPFALTAAQQEVLQEIDEDLCSGYQMHRLLQGDVGSGKTIVGLLAILPLLEAGLQALFLAPTTILAAQHAATVDHYLTPLGIRSALLIGKTSEKERKKILKQLKSNQLHLLIGTHALLNEQVQFRHLGIALIDEQQRFGVAQRALLWEKGSDHYPHILTMSATPIPRTLAMAQNGDLDYSKLAEKPAGRLPIITAHRTDANRLRLFGFIKEKVASGTQVYVVYPRIEGHGDAPYKDLYDGYNSMQRAFPELALGIMHGDMSEQNKLFEMEQFRKGDTAIMLSTTVIEVGVDVPNATIMVIENAEQFGLATLHQLRGRVGRGSDQSYCILMTKEHVDDGAQERIRAMLDHPDGGAIAAKDLKLRGAGALMGKAQSGHIALKLIDWEKDEAIAKAAWQSCHELLKQDPKLEQIGHQPLKTYLRHLTAHLPTDELLVS